jgi:hypothetical protein
MSPTASFGGSKIFRRIPPHFLVPARQALVIDRGKFSCEIGVGEALNGHRPGASLATDVCGCHAPELVGQFHSPPLPMREAS